MRKAYGIYHTKQLRSDCSLRTRFVLQGLTLPVLKTNHESAKYNCIRNCLALPIVLIVALDLVLAVQALCYSAHWPDRLRFCQTKVALTLSRISDLVLSLSRQASLRGHGLLWIFAVAHDRAVGIKIQW